AVSGHRSPERSAQDIRDTLATMNSDQIARLDRDYRERYHVGITDALAHANLPQETRDAISIYMRGTDQRTDADTQRLADIALRSRNIDMFQEEFRDASTAARESFLRHNGDGRSRE